MSINETVLEMHYHKAMLDVFRDTLGLGYGKFNFYKYSSRRECFVGFDQAFVKTELSEEELFQRLRSSALNNGYSLTNFFVGYFLQYKVVNQLQKRMRRTPSLITNRQYQRVSLDTSKNENTGFSQHELLYNLKQNHGAFVYYACPMIFHREELYNQNPDLDLLRLADVSSCPSDYSDNEKHFIYFNDIHSIPVWCSDPVEGKAISPNDFVKILSEYIHSGNYKIQLNLLSVLSEPIKAEGNHVKSKLLELVADSFKIIEFSDKGQKQGKLLRGRRSLEF